MDWLSKLSKPIRENRWGRAKDASVLNYPWIGWSNVKRIGVLFNANSDSSDLEELRKIVQNLKNEQKSVTLCGWTGQMRPKNVLYNGRQLIFIDDFNWKGAPMSGNALEFLQTDFDLIVTLHRGKTMPLDELASKTCAGIRVTAEGDEDFYDLVLKSEKKNYSIYFRELKQWLEKIKPSQ
jgi:hypothetical protein